MAVIVTVTAKFAVSVSVLAAVKLHGFVIDVQVPPVQLARRLFPALGVAVTITLSPTSTTQLAAALQVSSGLLSETVAVPLPVTAAVMVTVWAKDALSLSLLAALNLQGLVVAVQVPPDHPVKRLPEEGVAVIVIASPTSATQLVTPEQPAVEFESVIVAVPAPVPSLAPAAVVVVIVTVAAKFAVSVSVLAAVKVQALELPVHEVPDQLARRLPEAAVCVIVIVSPTSATQDVTFVQPACELESLIVAVPLPVTAAERVTVFAKFAVSRSVALALKLQGLAVPAQVPPDHPVKRLPADTVGVIVMASPALTTQLVALMHEAWEFASVIVAVPLPLTAVEIVKVLTNVAVSDSPAPALNVHGFVVALQVPPDQPVKRLPEAAVAVSVTESPRLAGQEVTPMQTAWEFESVIVAVPLPAPAVAVVTVTIRAKVAVSVWDAAALKVQGLAVPEQVPPDQPLKRLPDAGAGVIVIASPTSATQLVTPLQPARELPSAISAVPLPVPPTALVMVTVLAKVAVSVSVFEAVNVHGLAWPLQVPPDQPVKRLPEEAVAVIEIESPTKAVQWDWLEQPTRVSVTVAVPLPLTEAVIVTNDAAAWATGPGPGVLATATSVGAGGLTNGAGAESSERCEAAGAVSVVAARCVLA
ncbi:MAG TPA: hypothetical protein VGG41_06810 [Solirubrobacteraceae bacterium]